LEHWALGSLIKLWSPSLPRLQRGYSLQSFASAKGFSLQSGLGLAFDSLFSFHLVDKSG